MGSSKQAQQNPIETVVGRVMGGSTAAFGHPARKEVAQ